MDHIVIEGLTLETVVGVYAWEKCIRQTLVLDIEMGTDIRPAASDDELSKTLNYAAISERIIDFCDTHSFELIETYAERIARLLIEEFKVDHVSLKLSKPGAVKEARNVGVCIKRFRAMS